MNNIYIVTPLRDEIENLPSLVSSVEGSSYPIKLWVIVENNSSDGSKEYLKNLAKINNVEKFIVLNRDEFSSSYQLGGKYSAIVNEGFKYITENEEIENDDFIGILDADSFPMSDYYSKLIKAFEHDSCLGITSGRARLVGTDSISIHSKSWVMGSCRLWRYKCFKESGYIIGPSADTVSVALAEIAGWKVYPVNHAIFDAREVGKRVDFSYYGKSAYYRGNSLFYALIRGMKYMSRLQINNAKSFLSGYLNNYFKSEKQVPDERVRKYFSNYVFYSLKKRMSKNADNKQ